MPPWPTEHVFAAWPMPDAAEGSSVAPSYTANERTVTDNVTRLIWQRSLPVAYEGCTGGAAQTGAEKFCDWTEANSYCANPAVVAELGGGVWRLPTKIELESLLDLERPPPKIDLSVFPNGSSQQFWTLSPVSDMINQAWAVSFDRGTATAESTIYSNRVRCVRSQ
jgi:hypothetical protein